MYSLVLLVVPLPLIPDKLNLPDSLFPQPDSSAACATRWSVHLVSIPLFFKVSDIIGLSPFVKNFHRYKVIPIP